MEIRELKAFVTVAQELNFRKASDLLGMSQPPLTRLISQMEERLSVKLFDRTTRSVSLTGEGLHLLSRAKEILKNVYDLENELKDLKKNKPSLIKVALHPSALHSNVPKLISAYKEQFPNVKFLISEAKTGAFVKNVDVMFGPNLFSSKAYEQFELQSHELGFLVSQDNPLARKNSIKFSDLKGQTLIFHGRSENLGFQKELGEFLKKKKIPVNIYYKRSGESCPHLAVTGKGILISSKKLIPESAGGKFIPLEDYYPKLRIYATWETENQTLPMKAFVSFLQEQKSIPGSGMDYHFN